MRTIKVAFYGPVSEFTGYGTSARSYVHALHRAGIDLSVINLGFSQTTPDPFVDSLLNRKIKPDFHLMNWIPVGAIPLALFRERLIMATSLEAETFPTPWLDVLSGVREIWAPCEHNVSVFERQVGVPVFKWPKAIHPEFGNGSRADFSVLPPLSDADFVFYSVFVWQTRKNPLGIIESFLRAFRDRRDVVLILKTVSGPSDPEATLQMVRGRVGSHARVKIIDDMWTQAQVEALAQRGDCYVSLHRGEGWCNPLFDAACRGKPVVATGYSGPLDYLDPERHCLVRYRLIPVKPVMKYDYYNDSWQWADPDLDHAVELMQKVYEQRDYMLDLAGEAAEKLMVRYSSDSIGKLARERLRQLM